MQLQDSYIIVKEVTLAYENRIILNNVNLTVNKGDFMLITGANGGGKTSLLRLMLGLIKPTKGVVTYGGDKTRTDIGYLPQKSSLDMKFPISVREVIESGLMNKRVSTSDIREKTDKIISMLQLGDVQNNRIGDVSGGQFQRALFGRAIISSPSILVLDEPTSYLDEQSVKKIYDIINELRKTTTIVMVIHNIDGISHMANHIIRVEEGRVVVC